MKEDWFAGLATVIQKMDSAIHQISISETNCTIQWIVIYPVDSAIHLFNNWHQEVKGSSCP